MLNFYLQHNGGQPQVRGVHDEHHLFPFNSFDSLDEMKKSLSWFDDKAVPEGTFTFHSALLSFPSA